MIKEKGSNTRVSWSQSLPKESQFYNDLEYKVVEVSRPGQETELEVHRKRRRKSVIVKGCHRCSLKVGVYFKENPELGILYSDLYKGTNTCCAVYI